MPRAMAAVGFAQSLTSERVQVRLKHVMMHLLILSRCEPEGEVVRSMRATMQSS